MSEIKIDKNVPIPSKSKYPWDKMEVGDSFYIDAQVEQVGGRITHVRKNGPTGNGPRAKKALERAFGG